MTVFWIIFLSGALSFLLTGVVRHYALTRNVLDIPNYRSSHSVPTPRGGGLAFVIVFLLALPLLNLETPIMLAMLGGGGSIALLGFLDDHRHIPAYWRLLVHVAASVWVLSWVGEAPPSLIFGDHLIYYWLSKLFIVIYLVWLLNLYNFMDGINGIASVEAITVCLGGIVLYAIADIPSFEWRAPLLLMSVVLGFLIWNFPVAKIFMGDAGSGFLGMILGVVSIQSAWLGPELFWGWVILLGAFISDATVSLIRRVLAGVRFYEAHCDHAYQHAARRHGSHVPVTLSFGMINLIWLLPVAALVVLGRLGEVWGIILAYTPLLALSLMYNAGAKE